MRHAWPASFAAGSGVALAILAAGGLRRSDILVLAAVAAVSFGDLTRRAMTERSRGLSDPTDFWMSAAFVVILVGAAFDVGRDRPGEASAATAVALRAFGVGVIACGFAVRQIAARALGESFLVRLGFREGHTVVQSGPYRWVRHPTYSGLLAVALGTATAFASPLALLATFLVWLPVVLLRIGREERMMVDRFGSEYRDYCGRTWRLVPGVF